MIIDAHVHPIYFDTICGDDSVLKFRSEQFGIYKQSPYSYEEIIAEMNFGKIDRSILLPLDLTTQSGGCIVTNEEIKKIIDRHPDSFIGFASVDPYRKDALEVLENAFANLKLSGLKLNPSKQKFYPDDKLLWPIYEKCREYDKPIMFHAGLSWEPNALAKYANPIHYEQAAVEFPELRICLAHFAWPWVREMMMLMIKYPNVYTDTSMLYMDSFNDFMERIFMKEMDPLTLERNFAKQVMFGSNTPRFRAFKLKKAIENLPFSEKVKADIFGGNALAFLGEGK
ncbi:amidohydrolase family protein [Paenibacillus graminis]|uniref:Amidohydrolase n=1 Tax=Paenibacillus graminis TaxID=189425 RepID=A0A089M6V3_9BACL|nr:amidohydrolase family protein [Paenibacillus graminis]AIQ67243.1 amidohydrolase [Paenibacillus graminis]